MARYSVFIETPRGDVEQLPIESPALREACLQFIRAWFSRTTTCTVVLRAPCSKRYDHDSSARLVGQWSAWGGTA